jgi:hypothetical protein
MEKTSTPSRVTWPLQARFRPLRHESRLLLPLPLWPNKNSTSPPATSTETPDHGPARHVREVDVARGEVGHLTTPSGSGAAARPGSGPDQPGEHAERDLRGEEGARDGVDQEQERRPERERHRDEAAVVGTDDHTGGVRDDEPDPADHAADRHGDRRHQRGDDDQGDLHPLRVHAEGGRLGLAQREDVEPPADQHEEEGAARRERREHRDRPPADPGQAAEEPEGDRREGVSGSATYFSSDVSEPKSEPTRIPMRVSTIIGAVR